MKSLLGTRAAFAGLGLGLFLLVSPSNARAEDSFVHYKVKTGDTLSQVLRRDFDIRGPQLYGPKGAIQKVVDVNPDLASTRGNAIWPSQTVLIPADLVNEHPQKTRRIAEASDDDQTTTSPVTTQPSVPVTAPEQATQPVQAPPSAPAQACAPVSGTPTEAVVKVSDEAKTASSTLDVSLGGEYSVLTGIEKDNGTTGRLLSDLSPLVKLTWSQHWDESIGSSVFFNYKSTHFISDENGTRIQHDTFNSTEIGISALKKWSDLTSTDLALSFDQALFYRGVTGGGLEVNQIALPKVSAGLRYQLAHVAPLTLSALGHGSYWGPGTYGGYSIESGFGYDVGLAMDQKFESFGFGCVLGYGERRQNTSILELSEKRANLVCTVSK